MKSQIFSESEQYDEDSYQIQEFSNGIQYKKLQSLNFVSVQPTQKSSEGSFKIEFYYKYEGLSKGNEVIKILRNKTDFLWLASQMPCFKKRFVITPQLKFSEGWSDILSKLIKSQQNPTLKKSQQEYDFLVARRFLRYLANLTLKYMYWKPGEYNSPLFIFIQSDKYDYYRELYKMDKKSDESSHSGSHFNSYMSGILNYSKNMIKDYIPSVSRRSSHNEQIEKAQARFQRLKSSGIELEQQMASFRESLQVVESNFIQHQDNVKEKGEAMENLLCKLKVQNNMSRLINSEIDSVIDMYNTFLEKEEYMKDQLSGYIQLIEGEFKEIETTIKKIAIEFVELNCTEKNLDTISVRELYSDYKSTKDVQK